MTNLSLRTMTAGLKVPSDSQEFPVGEITGSMETRRQEPKGRLMPIEKTSTDEHRINSGKPFLQRHRLEMQGLPEMCGLDRTSPSIDRIEPPTATQEPQHRNSIGRGCKRHPRWRADTTTELSPDREQLPPAGLPSKKKGRGSGSPHCQK